ncbi:hypothetical protein [Burkholderia pseudomallei]|uniref:hypothetical protein n=1 Tax=Burkholderia pseudomallei TaxID=28450 RepID=UPI00050DB098|nr:hypothetical protein [Burkholderia pseudomallei]KGC64816.1 putative gp12 [Burkholderia pseudomallei]KGV61616.1 putative gp12 [Burkholderia pseudomallei ABCPW 91]KGV78768.1 putative gp12 [Burkholderia pseudomallei MSHR3964]KGV87643.1 putative gp12 [Burkholderia pseudomallei MSHR3951]KGV88669.1 putative gp12 [Burkholderia pseudomallei MSHR3960]
MNQKFSGEVGQVAGGDVKASNAQANVNIHLHSGAESKQYISERQRRAIGAKVFELEAKTGVEKLMVYRRLRTVFKFSSMDEMPRDLFERVMRYLDGWIRNGSADQSPRASVQSELNERKHAAPQSLAPAESQADHAVRQADATAPIEPEFTLAQQQKKQSPWLAVSIAVTVTIAVVATMYVVMQRPDKSAQNQVAAISPHCEYGGNRYSPGSVVMQAGVRRQCATTGDGAAWQKADTARR